MIVKLGSYRFQAHEASVSINKRGLVGDTGTVYAWEHTWDISGRLIRDSVSELTDAIKSLENACGLIAGDVAILFDDGTTTAHKIRYGTTLDGIRVIRPPSYPTSEGAEYVTYRTFQLTIQAEVGFTGGGAGAIVQSQTVSWNERVTVGGGLPVNVVLIPVNMNPIQQEAAPMGPYVGTQTGEAIGLRGYLPPPAVVFPTGMLVQKEVTRISPTESTAGNQDTSSRFPIQWSYRAVSPDPLFDRPNRR